MMKSEFENLAGRAVTDEQYRAIEILYMSSNLEKAEFVKSMRPMLKNIPQPEKKKDIKRMVVRDRSGFRKTPNGCYYHIEYVELVDIDIKTEFYVSKEWRAMRERIIEVYDNVDIYALYAVYVFVKMPSDKQLNKVREWLLYAVTKAEKELGGGTGQIKLRYVYDMFVARFAWLARVISFEAFSMMVDEALERMKKMLESNKAMQTLVSGEAGEVNE